MPLDRAQPPEAASAQAARRCLSWQAEVLDAAGDQEAALGQVRVSLRLLDELDRA